MLLIFIPIYAYISISALFPVGEGMLFSLKKFWIKYGSSFGSTLKDN